MAIRAKGDDWHHFVSLADVDEDGLDLAIEANEAECAAAARLLEIVGVESLSLEARIWPWHKAGLRLDGRVKGKVRQTCVVTLDPVEELIDEAFQVRFLPERSARTAENSSEIVIDALEDEDPPELMTENRIDLGALTVEHLALALNPYPRKKGVELEDLPGEPESDLAESRSGAGAFDVLRRLNTDGGDN